jgi:hypothetical protein
MGSPDFSDCFACGLKDVIKSRPQHSGSFEPVYTRFRARLAYKDFVTGTVVYVPRMGTKSTLDG